MRVFLNITRSSWKGDSAFLHDFLTQQNWVEEEDQGFGFQNGLFPVFVAQFGFVAVDLLKDEALQAILFFFVFVDDLINLILKLDVFVLYLVDGGGLFEQINCHEPENLSESWYEILILSCDVRIFIYATLLQQLIEVI